MIIETIVTTHSAQGVAHIAPMGVHVQGDRLLILPFRPSTTLDNLIASGFAVLNHTDDVRVFAGCLTDRREWALRASDSGRGICLADALAYQELEVEEIQDDPVRPRALCRVVGERAIAPFRGFNRAQNAVLEGAILVSRLNRLPLSKVRAELDYLSTAIEKTAGPREYEAWGWLMERVLAFSNEVGEKSA